MNTRSFILASAAALFPMVASAQQPPQPNTTVHARVPIGIFDKTPGGFLSSPNQLGQATADERFVVKSSKSIQTLDGTDVWLQVQPLSGGNDQKCQNTTCWVYWGKENAQQPPNLSPGG